MTWGTDRQIHQRRLGYTDCPFGFGKLLDEFTLHAVQSALDGEEPLALFFENVSSHHSRQVPNRLWPDRAARVKPDALVIMVGDRQPPLKV